MIHQSEREEMCVLPDVGDIKKAMGREFQAFIERTGLINAVVESRFWCGNPRLISQVVSTADHTPFALSMAPVTYEHGKVVPFNEDRNCVNQIQFLGYCPSMAVDVLGGLVQRSLEECGDGHMVLVKTKCRTLADMFSSLGFVRISGIRDENRQYVYSPVKAASCTTNRIPVPVRDIPAYDDADCFYYTELRRLFCFDLRMLIRDGWTVYERNGSRFLFTLTFGTSRQFGQRAFKVNVFDCSNGFFTGYHDVHVSGDSDVAISDLPAQGFFSEIPPDARRNMVRDYAFEPDKPDQVRALWMNHDALWVHPQHRRCGIGSTLTRVACDVCRYAFPGISEMQVCVHFENPGIYHFHVHNGAEQIEGGLYRLAYNLNGGGHPLIRIIRRTR
ncbi:GNAT family N-acetyltransferase [Candidatus Latescibacterota bacterium]